MLSAGRMNKRSEAPLAPLGRALADHASVLIVPHNDPDPDAMASAAALHYLLAAHFQVESRIVYGGIIGRSENKALAAYLGAPLQPLNGPLPPWPALLVDTQPTAGNHPLLPDYPIVAVFDHHPIREKPAGYHLDLRPAVGSTSTILVEYLQSAGLPFTQRLATALFYGIKTDTLCFGRGVSPADVAAFVALQPFIDREGLMQIEQAQVSVDYFRTFHDALQTARQYGPLLFAYIGRVAYPDAAAEVADWLLRLEGAHWVICVGCYEETLYLSIRTRLGGAGRLAQSMVGGMGSAGGHGVMAGGQIPLLDRSLEATVALLRQQALTFLELPAGSPGLPLMTGNPHPPDR